MVCEKCWAAGDQDISTVELAEAPPSPVASDLPRTAIEWFRAVGAASWLQDRRRDAAARMRGLVKELALRADWESHTTWPTWERLMAASGWQRSSTAAALAELQTRGWLVRLEGGSTPRFRPMALQHLEGNRAAVYQLRIPRDEGAEIAASSTVTNSPATTTWTPTPQPRSTHQRSQVVPTRARRIINNPQVSPPNRAEDGPNGPRLDQQRAGFFSNRTPRSEAAMLAAGLELQTADPALRRLGPRWIRSLLRPWWRAGWTNDDVLFALGHRPGTSGPAMPVLRCPSTQLRRPDGWVRHRLSAWQDESGPFAAPAADTNARAQVRAEHGQAAARRLPYGAATLRSDHLAASDDDRAQAAEQLVRQWAIEFHERRARVRPDHDIAGPDSARRHYQQISEQLRPGPDDDQPIVAAGPSTVPPAPCTPPPDPSASDDDATPTAHDRALERARAERGPRSARPSRRLRRFR